MMNTIEILSAVKSKIAKPENWTQNAYARDAGGIEVNPTSENAYSFCLIGAFTATGIARSDTSKAKELLAQAISENLRPNEQIIAGFISPFNDRRDHGDIIRVLDRAIELASNETAI